MGARRGSLRWQLSFAFGGMALLAVALLAAILLGLLADYYARSETGYLKEASQRVFNQRIPTLTGSALGTWTIRSALAAQLRLCVYDAGGALLADSGSPENLNPSMIGSSVSTPLPEAGGSSTEAPRSARALRVSLPASAGLPSGYVVLSGPPSPGGGVLRNVAMASLIAGALAVTIAALVGYFLAIRMARPISRLTVATNEMAAGDLSARAAVQANNEFGQLASSFNDMAERTEANVAALQRFVGDAAHQIGTPLTALQTDLQLAQKAATNPEEHRLVARAFAQAERLGDLADRLLQLSRIESAAVPGGLSSDVITAVEVATNAVASRAEAAGVDLRVAAADRLLVRADAARLEAIVSNLVENAVKFTAAGGVVSVVARPVGGQAVLTVSDTGVGIPAVELEAVFSRFHRAPNASGIPGNGLGLAIVDTAVRSLGGTVSVDSDDRGTAFTVQLPLVAVDAAGSESLRTGHVR